MECKINYNFIIFAIAMDKFVPYNNSKAVCYVDGEYTVKRVEIYENGVRPTFGEAKVVK